MNTPSPTPQKTRKFRNVAALVAAMSIGAVAGRGTVEQTKIGRAHAEFVITRADGTVEKWSADNVKTKVGIDKTFKNTYSTSMDANGLNYIACSNDSLTETVDSTTLSNEITLNGLGRAQGTYAHTAGTGTATISRTFTASGAQSVQKCALFDATSSGTMHHALGFTQRSLQNGDQLAVTFTITLS